LKRRQDLERVRPEEGPEILFLNRSYWPDVEATGQLLTELCSDLARTQRVTVIAGQPNFVKAGRQRGLLHEEEHEGVRIARVGNRRFNKASLLSRAIGLATYLLLTAWAAFCRRRPAVIVVETDPPLLGALGCLLKWWHRSPLVFYLQDLYPEVGLAMGRLRPGLLTRLLWLATQLGLRAADRVVVLGEDMKRRVLERGIAAAKIVVIPNWADIRLLRPTPPDPELRRAWGLNGEFVVMYSGNLGLSQNLEPLLEAARELRDEPVCFVLVGEGAAKASLEARATAWGLGNVRFRPYQPKQRLNESLNLADLHLIPLRRGLMGYIVPSKLYGILAAGKPYLAAVDADSELARITEEGQCGVCVEPDASGPIVEAVRRCLLQPEMLAEMGRRGRRLAEERFDRHIAVERFSSLLKLLAESETVFGRQEPERRAPRHSCVPRFASAAPSVMGVADAQ
jgi:glycosyltransferase involved in cell wall biosynthesis